jgi:hypothetical protein|tara:strand:+ start:1005 stop:1520 length:516 start_codon:yes stop_codon:yes gene_type:complete
MAINTTAKLSVDTTYNQKDSSSSVSDSRTGSLGYSASLTSGTGSLQVDAVFNLDTEPITSGSELSLNLASLSQPMLGATLNVSFNNVKSLAIRNTSTTIGEDISVRATGSDAFTAPFNGGSGNLLVKPAASYIYSDPYTGATVDSSNKNFQITNEGTGTININVVAVGVTG